MRFKILKNYIRKIIKFSIFLSLYPIIFFMDKFKKYKFIKLAEIEAGRIGATTNMVDGYFAAKDFSNYLKKYTIIFYFNNPQVNSQVTKMIKRVLPVSSLTVFFTLLHKALVFWKKNDHILDLREYSLRTILIQRKYPELIYQKSNLNFTKQEKEKGLEFLKKIGVDSKDEWICIHNRDSSFLKKNFKDIDLSYHNYRDFSVNSLQSASEFFASKGYFVFRMGQLQKEKFVTNNSRIIDYASSSYKNDFLDIYLLANSKFYFGADSGLASVSFGFMKPCYGVNYDSTDLYAGRWHHPWLFTFKRVKNLDNGNMLTLQEIISRDFSIQSPHLFYQKNNVTYINNTEDEIKSLAVEVDKDINGQSVQDPEDKKIQDEFWKIYSTCVKKKDKSKIKQHGTMIKPMISPSFLRSNIDLLN